MTAWGYADAAGNESMVRATSALFVCWSTTSATAPTRSLSVMGDGRKPATWAAPAAQMLTCAVWAGARVLLRRVQAALLPPDEEDESSDEDSDDDDASVSAPRGPTLCVALCSGLRNSGIVTWRLDGLLRRACDRHACSMSNAQRHHSVLPAPVHTGASVPRSALVWRDVTPVQQAASTTTNRSDDAVLPACSTAAQPCVALTGRLRACVAAGVGL